MKPSWSLCVVCLHPNDVFAMAYARICIYSYNILLVYLQHKKSNNNQNTLRKKSDNNSVTSNIVICLASIHIYMFLLMFIRSWVWLFRLFCYKNNIIWSIRISAVKQKISHSCKAEEKQWSMIDSLIVMYFTCNLTDITFHYQNIRYDLTNYTSCVKNS